MRGWVRVRVKRTLSRSFAKNKNSRLKIPFRASEAARNLITPPANVTVLKSPQIFLIKETHMASYAFVVPVLKGKTAKRKTYITEMTGPKGKEFKASRKRLGFTSEQVWLQKTPMGDFAVVYWEAKDIGKVFKGLMTSKDPFDKWFREKILAEIHGMKPSDPVPPLNEKILG